ncbi:MAG: SixA phosphatase family protein [Actinomycetes bacterium]
MSRINGSPPAPVRLRVLVRHADAGDRASWNGPDDWRGLSPLGRRQARGLVLRLRGIPVMQLLSSPALRCRQTVVPLAEARGLDIEPVRSLAVDADLPALMTLLNDPEIPDAVLCTHRETIELLLASQATPGTGIGIGTPMPMAAAWVVQASPDTGLLQVQSLASARLPATPIPQPVPHELTLPAPRPKNGDDLAAAAPRGLPSSQL